MFYEILVSSMKTSIEVYIYFYDYKENEDLEGGMFTRRKEEIISIISDTEKNALIKFKENIEDLINE